MNTKDVFNQALLSEASYALLGDITSNQSYIDALVAEGFSKAQAEDFVTHWRVADHQPNTADGFSATLFEALDASGKGTGKYSLAIRGTEALKDPINDLASADITDIGANGIAISQAIDLFNYYQRLTALPGTGIVQYTYMHKQSCRVHRVQYCQPLSVQHRYRRTPSGQPKSVFCRVNHLT